MRKQLLFGLLSLTVVGSLITGFSATPAGAATIKAHKVASGLNGPAAFTFMPNGRIVYGERGTGKIRILDPKTKRDRLFFRISGVDGQGERGLLGIALHPKWPHVPLMYAYVTRMSHGSLKNQIVRLRNEKGVGTHMSVLVSSPASSSPYHNGGRIAFGPDGRLYAIIGDGHTDGNAQDLSSNLQGKILRMTPDGGVPANNPIHGSRIYAFGIRNSFGFTWDPQTNRFWETENGPGCNDEINLIRPGDNYAWGASESCFSQPAPKDTNNSGPAPRRMPKWWFVATLGITGGAFCDGCGLPGANGRFLYGCVNDGKLRMARLNPNRNGIMSSSVVLDSPNHAIISMETSPKGKIYFSDFNGIYRLTA